MLDHKWRNSLNPLSRLTLLEMAATVYQFILQECDLNQYDLSSIRCYFSGGERVPKTMGNSEVFEFLKGKVAEYKIPKVVEYVDALPKTASGKTQKFLLKEWPKTGGLKSEAPACEKPRLVGRRQGFRHSDFEFEVRG